MDKIIYSLVYNRKKSLNKKGMALVQVEAYLNRKKKYFSTKVYLSPDQWDFKKRMVKNHPNADAINHMLYEFMAEIEKKELGLWQQGKQISLDSLKNSMENQDDSTSFIAFFRNEIAKSSLKESTKRNHLSTLELLRSYKKDVSFSELTFEFISSFDHYLQQKGYHTNTIAKHMKHLKRHINVAINKEYMEIQKYAFRKYKIKSVENNHTHLSPEELGKIESLELGGRFTKLEKTKDAFFRREGVKLTYMPAIAEATAQALAAYPQVNVSVDGYNILYKKHINVGIAVSQDDGNLIVPVVHDADRLNLNGLAVAIDSLAKKARVNKLMPDDIDGGTFTITNFGTFKMLFGTPIINQPQVAILGVGVIEKKPAVVETPEGDVIAIRHKMYLSLSYDHRVVDGSLGGNFLHFIADYLENWKE